MKRSSSPRGKRAAAPNPKDGRTDSRFRIAWVCAVLFGSALLLYLPTLRYPFLSWDDSQYVTLNPWIRGFTSENLSHIFTKTYFVSYMPLQLVSYLADFTFWGLNPYGYHLQSVLWNALDAVLAFFLVRRLLGSFALALGGAFLFAVHPAHVESVSWISARKDVLSAAFLFPSIYLYLRARARNELRMVPYLASIALFTLAVLAKVNVVVALVFLLLVDALWSPKARRDGGYWIRSLANKIPYGLVGLGVTIVNWIVEVKTTAEYARDPLHYFAIKGHAAWSYFGLLIGAVRPAPIYDTPQIQLDALSLVMNLSGLLVLPILFWIGFRLKSRVVMFGAGWMFVMMLPALFFPVPTYIADRYLYAACLGFGWLVTAGALWLSARLQPGTARLAAAASLVVLIGAFFAYRTARYNRVWADSESLWSYTIEKSLDFRAFNNLARVRMEQKRWDEAEQLFRLGARQPNVTSWEGLMAVFYNTKRYPQALAASEQAFRLEKRKGNDPIELAELHYKRGGVYAGLRENDNAIAEWESAVRLNPRHQDARRMLDLAKEQMR